EIIVLPNHLSHLKVINGGMIGMLINISGSLAIASKGMLSSAGVSTDINVSFINSAKEGDILLINSECIKFGKAMAYTDVKIYNKNTKKLIAQGRHTMYIAVALTQQEQAKF
ncbi:28679_t:CDS:1, partial [Dentiscutata erythropus]